MGDILNLQTADIQEFPTAFLPFARRGGLSCKGLPYYVATRFCVHGLNFTKTEKAEFMEVNFSI